MSPINFQFDNLLSFSKSELKSIGIDLSCANFKKNQFEENGKNNILVPRLKIQSTPSDPIDLNLAAHKSTHHSKPSTITRLSPKFVGLLAKYFHRQLKIEETSELAGLIAFPTDKIAASLFTRFAANQSSADDRRKLAIKAIFPNSARGAELLEKKLNSSEVLTLEERIELYSHQQNRLNPAAYQLALPKLRELFFAIHAGQYSRGEIELQLIRFVRHEIEAHGRLLSSAEDLSALFNLSKQEIRQILTSPVSGLSKDEIIQRAEKKALHRHLFSHAIDLIIVNSLRDLVYIENEMHRSGSVSALSTREEFAVLFGVKSSVISELLRYLPNEDWIYREKYFDNNQREQRKSYLLALTRREIENIVKSPNTAIASDGENAIKMAVLPVAIYHYMRDGLSTQQFELRELKLREQSMLEPHRHSILHFVLEELRAFELGQINRLSTNHELANIFHVNENVVQSKLSESETGLSASQIHTRNYVHLLQQRRSAPIEALRRVATLFIRERLSRADNVLNTNGQALKRVSRSSSEILEQRKRGDIQVKGVAFDSFEEATCALLLERYVPGFRIIPGQTVQISIDSHRFDFLVDGIILEYHPTLLFRTKSGLGSFECFEDYAQFNLVKSALPMEQRKLFIEETRMLLAQQYADKRRELLQNSNNHKSSDLIVAESPQEFYWLVLRRFGTTEVPPLESFLREFRRLKTFIKVTNQRE